MMRQRLVGALVLLCGGVIIWTLLFTGPAEYKVDRQSQIPPEPRVDPVLGVSPERPGGIVSADRPLVPAQPQLPPQDVSEQAESTAAAKDSESDADLATPAKLAQHATAGSAAAVDQPQPRKPPRKNETAAPESAASADMAAPGLDEHGLAEAWVIQVGSFSKSSNAESLKQRLQKGGHKAYVDQREYQGRPVYRVLVGPLLNRNTANSEKKNIDARFGVSSLVTRFEARP